MGQTTKGIVYPSDYSAAADLPTDLQTMAESIDNVLDGVGKLVVGYYYNGQFYEDSSHQTLITPATNIVYADITNGTSVNNQLYYYKNSYVAFYSVILDNLVNEMSDVYERLDGKENVSNKVTTLSSSSTDTQYPSAKCVYDLVGNLETILTTLDIGNGV